MLLDIFDSLTLSVTHFCQLSYNYITKYSDKYLINDYVKRYKSYVDASVHLNEYLENFNVLVNSVYEQLSNNSVSPKFSIFRLMTITWNREVLQKLESDQFSGKIANLFDDVFSHELSYYLADEHSLKSENSNEFDSLGDFQHDVSINSISTNYSTNINSVSINNSVIFNVSNTNADLINILTPKECQTFLKEKSKLFSQ